MNEKLILRSSKVNTFLRCRKRYYWEYVENLSPKDVSMPLQIGSVVHHLLHKFYSGELTPEMISNLQEYVHSIYPESPDMGETVATEAAILVGGYIHRWKDDNIKVISSEVIVEVDMGEYIMKGRVDGIARSIDDSRLWRLEHKTSKRMDSSYLSGLKGGLQGSMYDFLLENLFKEPIAGTIYNILVKTKVPQYDRAFSPRDMGMRKRMFETLENVAKDIKSGNFYPSCNCFDYGRPCEFKPLCDNEDEATKKAFYIQREYSLDNREEVEAV